MHCRLSINQKVKLTACFMALLGICCAKLQNPFTVYSNAGIWITYQNLNSGDTISIFSTRELAIRVKVKELVDSIVLSTTHNRLWKSNDTVIYNEEFVREPFLFSFSFYDTGRHYIIFTTYKRNGEINRDTLYIYVKSPLYQAPLKGVFDAPIQLVTRRVDDNNVIYCWAFSPELTVVSAQCSLTAIISSASASGRGRLWVTDGIYRSPDTLFEFYLSDTSKPLIECINESYAGGDTIYSSDSIFTFKVKITDRNGILVDSASINGEPFDRQQRNIYYKTFSNFTAHDTSSPIIARIFAVDSYKWRNVSEKTFFLIHSANAVASRRVILTVTSPSQTFVITTSPTYYICGMIENSAGDSLQVKIEAVVNGTVVPLSTKKLFPSIEEWEGNIKIEYGDNNVIVRAIDLLRGDSIGGVSFKIRRVLSTYDVTPPSILEITIDGKPAAKGMFVARSPVLLGIKVFDELSGLQRLEVNGKEVKKNAAEQIWYYDSIYLEHKTNGNEIVVYASDSSGNDTVVAVTVFLNRLPIVRVKPSIVCIEQDSVWTYSLEVIDPDGDRLSFEKDAGPTNMRVDNNGIVYWKPANFDLGMHKASIKVWDGYQPIFISFSVYVHSKDAKPTAVEFLTTNDDFPNFLRAYQDSWNIVLRVKPGTGIPPYRFLLMMIRPDKTSLLIKDSIFVWKPVEADTGLWQIRCKVTDALMQSDTIYSNVRVIPKNRPCTLEVKLDSSRLQMGTLDINAKRGADTIVFYVRDPDNPFYDRHTITIAHVRGGTSSIIDSVVSDSFYIVVDPNSFDGYDTVKISVFDRQGYSDSIRVPIYYGVQPNTPLLIAPAYSSEIYDTTVELKWEGGDADGDSLYYEVKFGANPFALRGIAIVNDTKYRIEKLQKGLTYYWQIISNDWKSSKAGPIWKFSVY